MMWESQDGILERTGSSSRLEVEPLSRSGSAASVNNAAEHGASGAKNSHSTIVGNASEADVAVTTVSITFCIDHAETKPGEIIRVVGDHTELGNWNPQCGVPLMTTPDMYPTWSGSVLLVPTSETSNSRYVPDFAVEYKYVRDCRDLGGGFVWEPGQNRCLAFPSSQAGAIWRVRDPCFGQAGAGTPQLLINASAASATFESCFQVVGERPLEKGTFGAVWKCRSLRNHGSAMFASKRIEKNKLEERDIRNLFGRSGREGEICIHQQQHHRNIVQLFDYFDDQHIVSLVLELCHGGDLFAYVNQRRKQSGVGLPERIVARVAQHNLSALAFLHNQRIAHRDVKCENVLLDQQDVQLESVTFKLCDFGFATRVPLGGVLHTVLGSAQTVAPEVLKRKPYSFPSDMWSAGVLLYIATAAVEPFHAETLPAVVKQIMLGTYSFEGWVWKETSQAAKSLIGALMTVDQNTRLVAQAALQNAWVNSEGLVIRE